MIDHVTIGYQFEGRAPERKTFLVSRTSHGKAAFESAVESLKVEMLQRLAMREAGNLEQGYDVPFIAKCAEILRLKPWAIDYTLATVESL